MDTETELKRKYELRETLIKAQKAKIQEWQKKAEDAEARLKAIDMHFRHLNWIQKLVVRLFRIEF